MATNPNRFACAQEAALLRDAIAMHEKDRHMLRQRTESARLVLSRAESALHDAQAVFATAQGLFESAKAKEIALEDEIREKRAFMHPVRKVPHDVWRLIFLEAQTGVLGSNDRVRRKGEIFLRAQTLVVRLAGVCRFWRAIAQDIPALWRFVHLEATDDLDSADILAQCTRLAVLRKRYTEGLHGCFVFDFFLRLNPGVARSGRFAQLFSEVSRMLHVSRSFAVFASDGYVDFQDSYLSQYFHTSTPHLESLVLTAKCYYEDQEEENEDISHLLNRMSRPSYEKLFPASPRLRNAEFGNFPLQKYASSIPVNSPDLKHISIWREDEFSGMDMFTALRLFPCAPTMQFSADLAICSVQAAAQYDALRSLRMVVDNMLDEGFAVGLSLPRLERITIDSSESDHPEDMSSAVADFLPRVCPNVAEVTLVVCDICALLAPVLRSLPRLRSLSLHACAMACDALFFPAVSTLFPALEELYIENARGEEGFTGQQLMAFIRRRFRKTGADGSDPPLRHISVGWESKALRGDLIEDWDEQYHEVVGECDVKKDRMPADELGALEVEFMTGRSPCTMSIFDA